MFVSTASRSIDTPSDAGQRLRQHPRIGVVLVQTPWPLFQRNQPGRRQNARLPHSTAQRLAIEPRPVNQLCRAHQHRANRRAQPLRQAEHHRIEAARQRLHIHAQRGGGVEDARSIQMGRQLALFGARPYLFQHRNRRAPPPARLAVFSISISPVAARNAPRA